MRLKKFSRFALALGIILTLLGLTWLADQRDDIFDDDNFPAMLMTLTGISLLFYVLRTQSLLKLRVYQDTDSLDNDLLFSESGDFEIAQNGAFNLILAFISAFGLIGVAFMSVFFWGFFLENPGMNRVNEMDEILGLAMAFVVTICGIPSFIYVLQTYNTKRIKEVDQYTRQ